MTKKDKIIACYGNLKLKSIAKIVNSSEGYVRNVISEFCIGVENNTEPIESEVLEMSVKEYSELKGITIDAVYKSIKRGTLKHRRIGNHIIVILD